MERQAGSTSGPNRGLPRGRQLSDWQGSVDAWVAADLKLIDSEDGWGPQTETSDHLYHWKRSIPGSAVKCFKVRGEIRCDQAALLDLLSTHLLERQKEWHELFLHGNLLEQSEDLATRVFKMVYRSDSILVSNRWCQYLLAERRLEDGFILTYRSVLHKDCVDEDGAERTDLLLCSHRVKTAANGSCTLTYIQQATPGGWVPVVLSNMAQLDIILNEFRKIRKVVQGKS